MCGIAGVLNRTSSCSQVEESAIAMAESIAYRGPDDKIACAMGVS
jgi:asparagine synthetase B (glutamine-hydrolysing)